MFESGNRRTPVFSVTYTQIFLFDCPVVDVVFSRPGWEAGRDHARSYQVPSQGSAWLLLRSFSAQVEPELPVLERPEYPSLAGLEPVLLSWLHLRS